MQSPDRPRHEPPANHTQSPRPAPPVVRSLALALAVPAATLVLLHPAGPFLLLALGAAAALAA